MPDNEREHSSDVENSNDEAVLDSSENKVPEALSLENCADHTVITSDFKENVKNPEATIETDKDECSANNIAQEIKRRFELLNVQYSFHANFYTMLFEAVRRFDDATIRNVEVLRVMPGNFNALWNKVKLMIATADVSGNCIDERAEEILDQLEQTVSHNRTLMLIAKAEIAGMYTCLSITRDTLIRCIQLYEEVLAETYVLTQNKCTETVLENLVAFWKYDLVRTYALLTNANKKLLASYGYSHGEVLSRLEELVLAVDSSDHIANKMKAQTWVNLANTFEHFKQNSSFESVREDVCMGLSLEDLFANAREYDPDNPVILMRSGRELIQRAKSTQDFEEAIGLLKMALNAEDIEHIQDIIYHHIGLAYKALWVYTEHPACEKIIENTYKFPSKRNKPLGYRVIKAPGYPLDPSYIPAPYKNPPRAAFWKTLIPIARDPDHPYLLESIRCFEKCIRYDDVSSALYFLDIARTYSNMRNVEKAREYFQKALNDPRSDSVDVDFIGAALFENLAHFEECEMIRKAFMDFKSELIRDTHQIAESNSLPENVVDDSLFENVAHFEECEMIRKAFSNSESEKVKSLYRESIRFSTISKMKTTVAFHYILRILYKQVTLSFDRRLPEMDQMILQNEYFLVYMGVHEATDNKYFGIVNSLVADDFRIVLMWRLIEMFHHRNQQYDAASAFTYLSILVVANKFTAEVKGIDLTVVDKQRMLLQAAERVAQQRVAVAEIRYLHPKYKELFDLQETDQEIVSRGSESLTDQKRVKLETVNTIMKPDFDPGYLRLLEQC